MCAMPSSDVDIDRVRVACDIKRVCDDRFTFELMRAKTGVLCLQHEACARSCREIWPLRSRSAPADYRRLIGRTHPIGARLVPLSMPRLEPIDRTREKSHFHRRLGGRLPHSERAGGRAGPRVQHVPVAVAVCRPDLARWTLRHRHDPIGNRTCIDVRYYIRIGCQPDGPLVVLA